MSVRQLVTTVMVLVATVAFGIAVQLMLAHAINVIGH